MARHFAGSNQHIRVDTAPITAFPFALVALFHSGSESANGCICSLDGGGFNDYYALFANGVIAGDPVEALQRNSAVGSAQTSSGYSLNTWHHACGIFVSSTDRRAFIDGGSKGTDSTSVTTNTPTRFCIGIHQTLYGDFNGHVAEVAIYDLSAWPGATDSDKADEFEQVAVPALALGYSPLLIPLGLVSYWPLIRDEDQDRVGGHDLTAYNSPTIAVHAPVLYPAPGLVSYIVTAAAARRVFITHT